MQLKTIKVIYWILLLLLCLFMLADAYGGITRQKAGVAMLNHLGYPIYIMPLMGWLKVLGVIALLQPVYLRIKEWVFAGLAFIFIGAAVSHLCAADKVFQTLMPLIFLAFMLAVRYFTLQYYRLNLNKTSV